MAHESEHHPARLAVFLSGSGRTLVNLADAIDRGELDAEIGLVVASRQCLGYDRARERNLPARVEQGVIPERRLVQLLDSSRIDWVVLAGYLKLLPIPAERITQRHIDEFNREIVQVGPLLSALDQQAQDEFHAHHGAFEGTEFP